MPDKQITEHHILIKQFILDLSQVVHYLTYCFMRTWLSKGSEHYQSFAYAKHALDNAILPSALTHILTFFQVRNQISFLMSMHIRYKYVRHYLFQIYIELQLYFNEPKFSNLTFISITQFLCNFSKASFDQKIHAVTKMLERLMKNKIQSVKQGSIFIVYMFISIQKVCAYLPIFSSIYFFLYDI